MNEVEKKEFEYAWESPASREDFPFTPLLTVKWINPTSSDATIPPTIGTVYKQPVTALNIAPKNELNGNAVTYDGDITKIILNKNITYIESLKGLAALTDVTFSSPDECTGSLTIVVSKLPPSLQHFVVPKKVTLIIKNVATNGDGFMFFTPNLDAESVLSLYESGHDFFSENSERLAYKNTPIRCSIIAIALLRLRDAIQQQDAKTIKEFIKNVKVLHASL